MSKNKVKGAPRKCARRLDEYTRLLIMTGKLSMRDACSRSNPMRIDYTTYRKWAKRVSVENLSTRHINGYKTAFGKSDAALTRRLVAQGYNYSQCYKVLVFLGHTGSRTAFYNMVKREGITKPKKKSGEFEQKPIGYAHLDVVFLPPIIPGRQQYLYVMIERNTRLSYFRVYERHNMVSAIDFTAWCADQFPMKINEILTDCGSEFRTEFDAFCQKMDIVHTRTQPRSPSTNGMVERMNYTIERECIDINHCTTEEQREKFLSSFMEFYNNSRPHMSLNDLTPMQKWEELRPSVQ